MLVRILFLLSFSLVYFGNLYAQNDLIDSVVIKEMMSFLECATPSEQNFVEFQEMERHAIRINYTPGELFAKKHMATFYRINGQFEKALDRYQQLYELSDSLNDKEYMIGGLYGLGMVYTRMNEFAKATAYLDKALDLCRANNLRFMMPSILVGKGSLNLSIGQTDEALETLLEGRALMIEMGMESHLPICNNNIGIIYVQKGKAKKALPYFEEYLDYVRIREDTLSLAQIYGNLAYVHQNLRDFKQAFVYYDSSLYYSEKLGRDDVSYITYLDMSDAYSMKGDYKNALAAQKKHQEFYKKTFNEKTKSRIERLEVKFDTERKEKTLLSTQKEVTNLQLRQQRMGLLIGSLVAGLIIAFLLFLKTKNENQRKREIQKIQEQLIRSELKNKNLESLKLKDQLSNKQSDLTNLALDIARKNDFSNQLIEQLEQLQDTSANQVKPQLKKLISFTVNHLQVNEDLALLQENVEQINQAFYQKLNEHFGNLTSNEKYLCGLIRLNLSNKDIASIKGISINSAKMNRYRLRKKLNLQPEEDIVLFLQGL